MESIKIVGFLTIKNADFKIKKINILIGAQASGKSIIAKLVYFFKHFFSDTYVDSIEKAGTKRQVEKECLEKFEEIFPKYSWISQEFEIIYTYEDYVISITRKKIQNRYILKFDYCQELQDFHRKLKSCYKKALVEYDSQVNFERSKKSMRGRNRRDMVFYESVYEMISDTDFSKGFRGSVFIPAARSFFANLQKNVFSFLASNIDIDPFIKEFGSRYESSKRFYQHQLFAIDDDLIVTKKKIDELLVSIIRGEYVYDDEQDWISNDGQKTNLTNASSGQQESLPMLLVLSIWPFMSTTRGESSMFLIEEPEAHLFPDSQKQIISLIATISKELGHSFFITTHSPYVLTAINNLVVGNDAYQKLIGENKKIKKLTSLIPESELIDFDDVSAYTVKKNRVREQLFLI